MADPIDTDALAAQIAADAEQPQATTFDGLTVQQRPLADQIAALKFLEQRQNANRSPLGRPIKLNRTGDALG